MICKQDKTPKRPVPYDFGIPDPVVRRIYLKQELDKLDIDETPHAKAKRLALELFGALDGIPEITSLYMDKSAPKGQRLLWMSHLPELECPSHLDSEGNKQ
ncbi:hypothetical protein [Phyllobacterium sp. SB3]|uniref:hypothetical protein n=1 Tax=Phyllobacterium sp. SB3 TaxID=3156073 RepID=UPI0032AEF8F9